MIKEMLEICCVALIIVELVILLRHLYRIEGYEERIDEHIKRMDEHIKRMDEHIRIMEETIGVKHASHAKRKKKESENEV